MSLTGRLCRVGAILLLAFGLGFTGPMLGSSACAQGSLQAASDTAESVDASTWRAHFDEQVARALREEPSMRSSLIRVTMKEATRLEGLDLHRTVGALLHVVENDSHRGHRLMALQALYSIAPEHVGERRYRRAMNQLYAMMQGEPSEQVRAAAATALNRYFGSG